MEINSLYMPEDIAVMEKALLEKDGHTCRAVSEKYYDAFESDKRTKDFKAARDLYSQIMIMIENGELLY